MRLRQPRALESVRSSPSPAGGACGMRVSAALRRAGPSSHRSRPAREWSAAGVGGVRGPLAEDREARRIGGEEDDFASRRPNASVRRWSRTAVVRFSDTARPDPGVPADCDRARTAYKQPRTARERSALFGHGSVQKPRSGIFDPPRLRASSSPGQPRAARERTAMVVVVSCALCTRLLRPRALERG